MLVTARGGHVTGEKYSRYMCQVGNGIVEVRIFDLGCTEDAQEDMRKFGCTGISEKTLGCFQSCDRVDSEDPSVVGVGVIWITQDSPEKVEDILWHEIGHAMVAHFIALHGRAPVFDITDSGSADEEEWCQLLQAWRKLAVIL